MSILKLPPEVEAVFCEFRTCELATLAKDGTPVAMYVPEVLLFIPVVQLVNLLQIQGG